MSAPPRATSSVAVSDAATFGDRPTFFLRSFASVWFGMPYYRRVHAEGGTYAFTVCLADRSASTLIDHVDVLRGAFGRTVRDHPVRVHAMCVLPDHLHAVWTLPEGDAAYPLRWQLIKRRFGDALGRRVWQPRYWEHTIRDDADLANHVNYVHWNPVKHGLVRDMDDWPQSTWHRWKGASGRRWTPPPDGMRMAQGRRPR